MTTDEPIFAFIAEREAAASAPPREFSFFVPGIPQPGGSKKGFVNPRNGRVVIVEDAKRNKDWRACVALAGSEAIVMPLEGPLEVEFHFVMPRPKGHYGSGRNAFVVKATAPYWHTKKPDRTKLQRSTEDALTGIAWRDDCQVVNGPTSKSYGNRPGCLIKIRVLSAA